MKRPRAHVIGDLAQSQLTVALQAEGCAVGPILPDYGEDLSVELPESGEVRGARLLVQVKGTQRDVVPHNGRIRLARIKDSLLKKWEATLTPVALVLWNTTANSGHYALVNTPNSFLSRRDAGRRSKIVVTTEEHIVGPGNAAAFLDQALLAHRMNAELLCGVYDLDAGSVSVPEAVVQRNAEMLVTAELLRRELTADGETGWKLSFRAREMYAALLDNLSRDQPSWTVVDLMRRAAVLLVARKIGVHSDARVRLIHGCVRVIWPMINKAGVTEEVASWGHPFGATPEPLPNKPSQRMRPKAARR